MAVKRERALTGKQRLFVEAYFAANFNATAAARRAGYKGDEHTLCAIASENLTKPVIRAEIDKRMRALKMGGNEVLARLSFIANGSMDDFLDPDSFSVDLKKAKRAEKLGLIKKLKVTTITTSHADRDTQTETIEFELHDVMRALEMLGKHHKVFDRAAESDWRTEAIAMIRQGEMQFKPLSEEFGTSLAEELFRAAGVEVHG